MFSVFFWLLLFLLFFKIIVELRTFYLNNINFFVVINCLFLKFIANDLNCQRSQKKKSATQKKVNVIKKCKKYTPKKYLSFKNVWKIKFKTVYF